MWSVNFYQHSSNNVDNGNKITIHFVPFCISIKCNDHRKGVDGDKCKSDNRCNHIKNSEQFAFEGKTLNIKNMTSYVYSKIQVAVVYTQKTEAYQKSSLQDSHIYIDSNLWNKYTVKPLVQKNQKFKTAESRAYEN